MITKRTVTLAPDTETLLTTSQSAVIFNRGLVDLYVGDRGVTTDTGFIIEASDGFSFELENRKPLYAIATQALDVILLEEAVVGTDVPQHLGLEISGSVNIINYVPVITSATDLPASPTDGQQVRLVVGAWPNVEIIEFTYYVAEGHWISESISVMTQSDQVYMGNNDAAFTYVSTTAAGLTTGAIGWTTRAIRKANLIIAAGFKLQSNFSAIIAGTSANLVYTTTLYWYNHNNADAVTVELDGSAAIGENAQLASAASSAPAMRTTGYSDVLAKGTANPLGALNVTKDMLWPRLFGKVPSGANRGQIIDTDVVARWYH